MFSFISYINKFIWMIIYFIIIICISIFEFIVIAAPVIVRMLQHIISDEVHRNGFIKYLHTQ